jgi:ketosteroid isomerase-like protein
MQLACSAKTLALALGAVLALAAPAATLAAPSVADQIRVLEDEISAVYAANDLPRYFAYYADDLRALFPEGHTDLPGYKASWTDFIKGGGAILAFTYSDLKVQVAPGENAAVASYRAKVRTRYPDKGAVDEVYDETDVFFRRDGKWRIVEIHYSPVAAPAK